VALRRSLLWPMLLVVLAHGRPDPTPPGWPAEAVERLWQQLQRELAQLVSGGRLVVATDSGHDLPHEQPELILDAIGDVVWPCGRGTWFPTTGRLPFPARSVATPPGLGPGRLPEQIGTGLP
jgi:pimeloyl-ACP methyl ester carboxylesterase